jgi:hypothetical protein
MAFAGCDVLPRGKYHRKTAFVCIPETLTLFPGGRLPRIRLVQQDRGDWARAVAFPKLISFQAPTLFTAIAADEGR